MGSLDTKVAHITGGAMGIGGATARRLAGEGSPDRTQSLASLLAHHRLDELQMAPHEEIRNHAVHDPF